MSVLLNVGPNALLFESAKYPAFVTALTVLVFVRMLIHVGKSRVKYNVPLPATTGSPDFERVHRAQVNQVEQLTVFFPTLWIFSLFVHAPIGAALGLAWLAIRIGYFVTYCRTADPKVIVRYTMPAYYIILTFTVGILVQSVRAFF